MLLHFHNPTCVLLPSIFSSIFHPYLLIKSSSQFPLTVPSSIPQQFSTSLFLRTSIATIYTKSIFPTSAIWPTPATSRDQGARESCEDWHRFNLSFLPESMDSDNRAHNHWILIARAEKIGMLQVVVSDEYASNRNGKLSNPPIPSTHFALLPYPTIKRTHIPLDTNCFTWFLCFV